MTNRLKTSLIFTSLSLTASALNFIFYPVISHLLSARQFGDIQIGVSFIMVAAALFTSLNTLALYLSAQRNHTDASTLPHVERLAASISIALAIAVLIFAKPIQLFLNLEDQSLLYILAFIFAINVPASTWVGALQGNGQFIASGWVAVSAALSKIVFSAIFISIGWGAHGALIGMLLGFFIILPMVKLVQNKAIVSFKETLQPLTRQDIAFFRSSKTPLVILFSMILVAIIANIDVTIAKITLDPVTAGQYAQLSTAAKIPYFGLVPLAIIFFKDLIDTPSLLKSRFSIFIGISIAATACTYFFETLILQTIFNYEGDSSAFIWLVIAFSLYAIATLCMYTLIARGLIKRLLIISISSLIVTLIVLGAHHDTIVAIAQSFILSLAITTSSLFLSITISSTPQQTTDTI